VLEPSAFIVGQSLYLRKVAGSDVTDEYLRWLNDPEVLRYSARKAFPQDFDDLRRYISHAKESGELHLAICRKEDGRHVGNISLQNLSWTQGAAVLSIMIGAREVWGRGYGREAIALLTAHAFSAMGLRRLTADSPNPAFIAAVKRLGWTHEGVRRQAILVDGVYADLQCFGILRHEFQIDSAG